MNLSRSEAQSLLKTPKNKSAIEKGRTYESRLRLFTEPLMEEELEKEPAYKWFVKKVHDTIGEKRGNRAMEFLTPPFSSVEITGAILSELEKVFDAKNPIFTIEAPNNSAADEVQKNLLKYKATAIKWVEENGKKAMKNQPNLIAIVDKDAEGEPYTIAVSSEMLVDGLPKEDGTFEYIAFIICNQIDAEGNRVDLGYVYDDSFYRVHQKDAQGEWLLIAENEHTNGACPARFVIDTRLNAADKFSRLSPIAPGLGKLREWQSFDIYKTYVDHYASFPVVEMVDSACKVEGCSGGQIRTVIPYVTSENIAAERYSYKECPECSERKISGPGLTVRHDPQLSKDQVDNAGKFRFITPDTKNLEYLDTKLMNTETSIKLKAVGHNDILTREAINEEQVKGSFESKRAIFLRTKAQFDRMWVWDIQTKARLLYGKDVKVEVSGNFGTEFYLYSEMELLEIYKEGIEAGIPQQETDYNYRQYIETKYKGNKEMQERQLLINKVNPMPYDNLDSAKQKRDAKAVTNEEFILYCNLNYYVALFEAENGSISKFGSALEKESDRIEKIRLALIAYIPTDQDTPTVDDLQKTALNGAQVSALIDVCVQVSSGTIPASTAATIVQISFNVDEETAKKLVSSIIVKPIKNETSKTEPPSKG